MVIRPLRKSSAWQKNESRSLAEVRWFGLRSVSIEDFGVEVELLKNNPEFMKLMKQLSQEKAAISLPGLRKELGL